MHNSIHQQIIINAEEMLYNVSSGPRVITETNEILTYLSYSFNKLVSVFYFFLKTEEFLKIVTLITLKD